MFRRDLYAQANTIAGLAMYIDRFVQNVQPTFLLEPRSEAESGLVQGFLTRGVSRRV
jgi:hypothetical protein